MLTPQKLDRLRGYLLEQQANLQQQIAALTDASQESNVGLGNHMAEDATAAFDQAASVSLLRGHMRTLQLVEAALQRMARGTYGKCDRCGKDIDFARLKAVPEATLCLYCQRVAEL
ncbi:MAG: General stress protein 16O [Chloroflexi bacterium ADurb.Bin325]|nr:MAG: General stress protein 16O [Chloroflexi bacterium ADurb.Bin325]